MRKSSIGSSSRRGRRWWGALGLIGAAVAAIVAVGCGAHEGLKPLAARQRPRLAVLMVIDQARPDYLTRFAPYFTKGFRRLIDSGAFFPNVYHDHANTETAVGHAALSTGCFPNRNGIIANEWYERAEKRLLYCCEDSSAVTLDHPKLAGRSPRRLQVPAVGDWLKQANPESKVVSVSVKDRAAILLGGLDPDGVCWFDRRTGDFVTSSYYSKTVPEWLRRFNARRLPDSVVNGTWGLLLDDSAYARFGNDDVPNENDAVHTTFPHTIDIPDSNVTKDRYREFVATPFADQVTLRLAEQVVQAHGLGNDDTPDLLCVSCSAADAIGHRFGPSSWEIEDYYLRMDGYVAEFLAFLDATVGAGNYVVAISSDHGVSPFPELLATRGVTAYRQNYDSLLSQLAGVGVQVGASLGLPAPPLALKDGEPLVDYAMAEQRGIAARVLDSALVSSVRGLPYIADVFTRDELSRNAADRPYGELYVNVYHPQRGPDLYLRLKEHILVTNDSTGASHGTPYADDSNVPLLLFGKGIAGERITDRVRTVDIAPTLAELLGMPTPASVDGHSLRGLLSVR